MSDFYMYDADWQADSADIAKRLTKEAEDNNPGREVDTAEYIHPVPGVDDSNVGLFRVTFVPEEETP